VGPQSWYGCGDEDKSPYSSWKLNPARPTCGLITMLIYRSFLVAEVYS